MLGQSDPGLLRAAHDARRANHEITLVELPFSNPVKGVGRFLFRAMNYLEFDAYAKDAQLGDITDILMEEMLLYPRTEKWEENPIHEVEAGQYEEMAVLLVKGSGFDEKRSLLEAQGHGRSMASTPFSAAQMFICKAFPGMSPAEVARLPVLETFRLVGMAEHMLGSDGQPLQFPLRDFFGDQKPKGARAPLDFSRLPVYSQRQLNEMQGDARAEFVADAIRKRREVERDPEAKARRGLEIRRNRMAQIAEQRAKHVAGAAAEEADSLRAEFGDGR